MVYIENHEFLLEINKLHQTILNVEYEFERAKQTAYGDLARYLKTYAPKDLKTMITAPPKQAA